MYTNASVTYYSHTDIGFLRHYIEDVFVMSDTQDSVSKDGSTRNDNLKIYIPAEQAKGIVFKVKDLVVKRLCEVEFDNQSDKGISDSLKELKRSTRVYEVYQVTEKLYGSKNMQHIELAGR